MANQILLKRGLHNNLPTDLAVGEPAFTTDTGKLYIGSADGNVEITKDTVIKGDVTSETLTPRYITGKFIKEEILDKIEEASTGTKIDGVTIKRNGSNELYVGTIPQTSVTNLVTDLSNRVVKNANINPGTKAKITYDAKGLVTAGADLALADLPALTIAKTTGLQTALDGKVEGNTAITAKTGAVKINYDAKGLVTGSSAMVESDIPTLSQSKITNLTTDLGNRVIKNADLASGKYGTFTKITYDSKGLVTAGTDLIASDIPTLPQSKITNLVTDLSNKVDKVSGKGLSTNDFDNTYKNALATLIQMMTDDEGTNVIDTIQEVLDAFEDFEEGKTILSILADKVEKNDDISAKTGAVKINYDKKGLVTGSSAMVESDIPTLSQSKITNLTTDLGNRVIKNSNITAGTKTKITYDAKGLVTAGADLTLADLPALTIAKTTGLQAALDAKMTGNTAITAGTGIKISYDAKGLVTGSSGLTAADIPSLAISKITNLQTALNGKIDKLETATVAATKPKVTYNTDGLVTAGADLVAADIPSLAISKITGLQTALDGKVTGNTAITAVTGAVKVNYDTKGLITGSSAMVAADIPSLAASKITSGEFATARIPKASAAEATAMAIDTKFMTPIRVGDAIGNAVIDGGTW